MYIDAFLAVKQCQALEAAATDESHNERFFAVCYYGFILHERTFLLRSDQVAEKYNYREICRDSLRCHLIHYTIQMKKYLLTIAGQPPQNVDFETVGRKLISNLIFLKFGLNMLSALDFHVKQIVVSLETMAKYGAAILKQSNCYEEFVLVAQTISQEFGKKMLPLNEKNLGLQIKGMNKGGKILELEKNYRQYLSKDFLDDVVELQEIEPEQLMSYEMPFNLAEMFPQYFMLFKANYKAIIRNVHAPIAKDNQAGSVQDEDSLNEFEKTEYKIDFKQLMREGV